MRTAAVLLLAFCSAAPARAEEMAHRLGLEPMVGYVSVHDDSVFADCHDSFFSGGQSLGFRLNMGITRWFSIAFTLQPAFWSVRRGHFFDSRTGYLDGHENACGEIPDSSTGPPISGTQRFVITSLAQKASFKVQDNANAYILLGEGIYHRQVELSWKESNEEAAVGGSARYTGLALAFGMDLFVRPWISLNLELAFHLLSDSYGAGAVLLAPHLGLTYWIDLSRTASRG